MQRLIVTCAVSFFVLCKMAETVAAESICKNHVCQPTEVCRGLESCDATGVCSVQPVCISPSESDSVSGGCTDASSKELLVLANPGFDIRVCYTKKPCPEGYYCSTALQDVSSRCCSGRDVIAKPGSCPAPDNIERFFCVDECLSDADCSFDMKCCQNSVNCTKKTCKMPLSRDPCASKVCPSGQACVANPDNEGVCVPAPPPPVPGDAGPTPPQDSVPSTSYEQLCQSENCLQNQECRLVETCTAFSCNIQAECVPRWLSSYFTGNCGGGQLALMARDFSGFSYTQRTCGGGCGQGFNCVRGFANVLGSCCPAAAVQSPPTQAPSLTGGPQMDGFGQSTYFTCPDYWYPMRCQGTRRCGHQGGRQCSSGSYCCATLYCGNICRTPKRAYS